jgi:quercetin 2,3-dioxygenase
MIRVRLAEDRGHADHGWLNSYHTFSFGDYFSDEHMGFRSLRVINEDRVQPARGFGNHGHESMEIISYVLEGALSHKDSLGSGSTLKYGDVQRMSAGDGVRHSEFNGSEKELVHFLQIWILPERDGGKPAYEEKNFTREQKLNKLKLIVSREGAESSLKIQQDAAIYAAVVETGKEVKHSLKAGRHGWVQVARGTLKLALGGESFVLKAGDGAAISNETALEFTASGGETEFLFFDLN